MFVNFYLWHWENNRCLLTGTVGGGKLKPCGLTAPVAQDADQLTLVGDAWTQPTDGVGVEVAGDGDLFPWRTAVFLPERGKKIRGGGGGNPKSQQEKMEL